MSLISKSLSKINRNLSWKRYSKLPKQPNKVVFQSYYGRGYSDSPRAIAEELRKKGGFELYWVVKSEQEAKSLPEGIIPISIDSKEAIRHQCTAKVWVDNCRKWAFTQKASSQFYVQTWHGFPLKRIEKDAGNALPADYIEAAKKDSQMCNLMVSNSSFLSDIYRNGFWYDGDIIECGFPRNDILVNGDAEVAEKAREALGLSPDVNYLLYAPTFRKGMGLEAYDMDYESVIDAMKAKFGGEWRILAKLHPNVAQRASELNFNPEHVINASDYPDILELYLLSSAMISDYSSVMFDYMLTKKPCFLYVNDLADYQGDRNFYFDLSKLPYQTAQNNTELCDLISSFRETDLLKNLTSFEEEFKMKETGKAAKQVADIIAEHASN